MEDFVSRDAASTLITETAAQLIADREHGASWLSREAARLLARLTAPVPVGQARPGSPSHTWRRYRSRRRGQAWRRWRILRRGYGRQAMNCGQAKSAGNAATLASEQLQRMHTAAAAIPTQWETSAERIADAARPLVGEVVFTLSRSGTVEAALTRLGGEKGIQRVFVAESRPGRRGNRHIASAGGGGAGGLAGARCGGRRPYRRGVIGGAWRG